MLSAMKKLNNTIQLIKLSQEHTIAFKEEIQEAFQHGFQSYSQKNRVEQDNKNQWQVLPDKDFYQSLEAEGAEAYEAVNERGAASGWCHYYRQRQRGRVGIPLCEGWHSEQGHRSGHLESYRGYASGDRSLGDLHPIFRPSQHPFLHQSLWFPCR